jgi:uroporphyrinogen decarboxylase
MTSRERTIYAIEHKEPDRVPLEGPAWAPWSYPFMQRLLQHFELKKENAHPWKLTKTTETLYRKLGIDFRPANLEPPEDFKRVAVFEPCCYDPWNISYGNLLKDEWGIVRKLDSTKSRSTIVSHPLRNKKTKDYKFPNPDAPGRYKTVETVVKKMSNEYLISSMVGGGVLFTRAWFLRGFSEFIHDLYRNPEDACDLLDNILEVAITTGKHLAEIGVDIVCIADDIGAQNGMLISPTLWRKYMKPRMKIIINKIKRRGVYILYHSDGDIRQVIPDLIEIGVDIVNPIQPDCMDPAEIKRLYGDKLTLSGTISIQETLVYGSPESVQKEVVRIIKTCGNEGGLIISPSNQALPDVKLENFLMVYETVKKFGDKHRK